MITNELNTGLVNAVREKLPSKENLANTLMDILYIGKEAIYRRLRGEVPFTLTEAAIISRKLGISLDKMIGVSFQNNAVFPVQIQLKLNSDPESERRRELGDRDFIQHHSAHPLIEL